MRVFRMFSRFVPHKRAFLSPSILCSILLGLGLKAADAQGFNILFDTLGHSKVGEPTVLTANGGVAVVGKQEEWEGGRRGDDEESLFFARIGPEGNLKESRSYSLKGNASETIPLDLFRLPSKGYGLWVIKKEERSSKLLFLELGPSGEISRSKVLDAAFLGSGRDLKLRRVEDRIYLLSSLGDGKGPGEQAGACQVFVLGLRGKLLDTFQVPIAGVPEKIGSNEKGVDLILGEGGGGPSLDPWRIISLDSSGGVFRNLFFQPKTEGRKLAKWQVFSDRKGFLLLTRGEPEKYKFRISKERRQALMKKRRKSIREKVRAKAENPYSRDGPRSKEEVEKRVNERMEQWKKEHRKELERGVMLYGMKTLLIRKDPKGKTLWKKELVFPHPVQKGEEDKVYKGALNPRTGSRGYFETGPLRVGHYQVAIGPDGAVHLCAKFRPFRKNSPQDLKLLIARIEANGELGWSRSYPLKGGEKPEKIKPRRGRRRTDQVDVSDGRLLIQREVKRSKKGEGEKEVPNLIKVAKDRGTGCSSGSIDLRLKEVEEIPFDVLEQNASFGRDADPFTREESLNIRTRSVSER